jgi:hypothetical protein
MTMTRKGEKKKRVVELWQREFWVHGFEIRSDL